MISPECLEQAWVLARASEMGCPNPVMLEKTIVAVGYRVNCYQATQFRIWATKTLQEFIVKGFVLDDARLKQGKQVFGKDYFDELLERIREVPSPLLAGSRLSPGEATQRLFDGSRRA